MLPFDDAREVTNLLADRFEVFDEKATKDKTIAWLMKLRHDYHVVRRAVVELLEGWKARRHPTPGEIEKACERVALDERRRGPIVSLYETVRKLRADHGDHLLTLDAVRDNVRCPSCVDEYVPRGVDPEDRLLYHRHPCLDERNRDLALEIAIADAKQAMGHTLEAKAQPRTPEQVAAARAANRPIIEAIKALFEKARPPVDPREPVPARELLEVGADSSDEGLPY